MSAIASAEPATTSRKLKVGLIGLGAGAADLLAASADMNIAEVVAGADVTPTTLERFKKMYPEARTYSSADDLCSDRNVEVVWVSSPNHYHAPHTIAAARAGKHVVVEKPMAISLEEAQQMIDAAEASGTLLLAGHTPSFTRPIRAMRRIISSGKLGTMRAATMLAYSDWMLRPRTEHELDLSKGAGLVMRSAVHQVDTIRFLGGGMLRSVRGMTGQWFGPRPIPGYFGAYLEFEDGTPALITHNSYGYFISSELIPGGEDRFFYTAEERAAIRRELRGGGRDENAEKAELRVGGERGQEIIRKLDKEWLPGDIGYLILSCDRADMRNSPHGIYVHSDAGKQEVDVSGHHRGTDLAQRRAELEEIYDAIVNATPLCHDGRWGKANLETCLALIESARERKEIYLRHQVPLRPGYDADFHIAGYTD